MKTLELWIRPAIIAVLWIVASAFTLSELATIGPVLRSAAEGQPSVRESRRQPVAARAQPGVRSLSVR